MEYYQDLNNDSNSGCFDQDYFANNDFGRMIPTNTNTNTNSWFDEQEDYSNLPINHQTLNNSCSSFLHHHLSFLPPPHFSNQTLPNYSYHQLQDNKYYSSMSTTLDHDEDGGALFGTGSQDLAPCKLEPSFNMGNNFPAESESEIIRRKKKKVGNNGQPSKNLMAERRRRKRLNDRLSMLRSVVPRISKMDRTSILGDTIDYMKELLERINNLQEEMDVGSNQLSLMTIFNDVLKPKEILVRNSPKFDVESSNSDTRIEIGCGGKPGMLLSTVTTLEALGLEIQHCVISCFNDFAMQASCCSQELKQREILDSEDIKEALIRNAGYGGQKLLN
ncbi:hypothetical protein BUALT_Bualt15G0123000 [Buddleja alternifolia]|uniref:BHLH domain-containing protein n=1 Tax=Buddleja alternifolia TaxID=168488 RepID=A0AAV6WMB7_9LAMI|nr:hypothetical protein BUALT_Bualt15G0123000 [Buddleja alternifolia]